MTPKIHRLQLKPVKKCSIKTINQVMFGSLTVIAFSCMVTMQLRPHLFQSDPKPGSDNKPGIDPGTGSLRGCIVSGCDMFCANIEGNNIERLIFESMKNISIICKNGDGVRIVLSNLNFMNGTIASYFLRSSSFKLASLHIYGGNLTYIQPLAFASEVFMRMQTLTLEALNINELRNHSLENLPSLKTLNVRSCELGHMTTHVLSSISSTLRSLQIEKSKSWQPSSIIQVDYPLLENLDLRFNNFGNLLNKNSFVGVTRCKQLYLASCKITAIENGTFDHFEYIVYINLNDNYITILPEEIFNKIISLPHYAHLRIDLHKNPWLCTCELEFLKVMHTDGLIVTDPRCSGPPQLSDLFFSSIKTFCNNNTSGVIDEGVISTTNKGMTHVYTVDVTTKVFEATIKLTCGTESNNIYLNAAEINSIYRNVHASAVGPVPTFSLNNTERGVAIYIASYPESKFHLIWFQIYTEESNSSLIPKNISCLSSVSSGNIIELMKDDMTYVFCLVPDSRALHLPLQDCLSHKMTDLSAAASTGSFSKKKNSGTTFFIISMFLCLMFSATTVYITVKKKYTLLNGTRRILFFHHQTDASVLPATLSNYPGKQVAFDNSFSVRSYRSDCSSPSYIMALRTTEEELTAWRLARGDMDSIFNATDSKVPVYVK